MRELVNEAVTIDTKLFIHDHSQLQVFAVKDETGKPDKTVHFFLPACDVLIHWNVIVQC